MKSEKSVVLHLIVPNVDPPPPSRLENLINNYFTYVLVLVYLFEKFRINLNCSENNVKYRSEMNSENRRFSYILKKIRHFDPLTAKPLSRWKKKNFFSTAQHFSVLKYVKNRTFEKLSFF